MNVYFYTLGCKVNQYETQEMSEILEREGYTIIYSISATPYILYTIIYMHTENCLLQNC